MEKHKLLLKKKLTLIQLILKEIEAARTENSRAIWVRPFWERGAENPHFTTLVKDLRAEGDDFFRNFAHVPEKHYQLLCEKVRPIIGKRNTPMRVAISVEERVALTLKYLATGDSCNTLSQVFRISKPSIVEIIPEVCSAFYEALLPEYLQVSFGCVDF